MRSSERLLEEKAAERATALGHALDQAETANLAKSTFLANRSHKLHIPLNAMLGYAQVLKRA